MGICLLHAIGHWSFRSYPADPPAWLALLNTRTQELGVLLFEGKAYAVFAMMFGVSFFLILDHWSRRGIGLRGRFLWRLALLAIIGYLHGIIFCGDLLLPIAVLGVSLVFLHRLGNRALAWIAVVLLLQIPMLWDTGRAIFEPGQRPPQLQDWAIYRRLFEVFTNGSFLEVSAINAGEGQLARMWWILESGRYTQMMGLFVCGLLIGRSRLLEDPIRCERPARWMLVAGLVGFVILHAVKGQLAAWGLAGSDLGRTDDLLASYRNLAQVAVYVGAFVLLYRRDRVRKALALLAPCGRMSLTIYVAQGLIGVPLFYGYGLALHRHLGQFASVVLGAALFTAQCVAAHFWLKRFHYGPLEWLWRCATFLDFTVPMRRAGGRARGGDGSIRRTGG